MSYFTQFASIVDQITGTYQPVADLEADINKLSVDLVLYSSIALITLVVLAAFTNDRFPKLKLPVFSLITLILVGTTFTLIGSTVYLNMNSDSKGPIHWHADFEVWACDSQLELRDPVGALTNKIGTAVLHEHDDQRIHLEGVAVDKEHDASLGKFFYVIGGAITDEALVLPLNEDPALLLEDEEKTEGPATSSPQYLDEYIVNDGENGKVLYVQDGQMCGQEEADVQVFVYRYDEETDTYTQFKLEKPQEFVIYEDSVVPPGDCIIIEFDVTKEKTDKICTQYGVRDIDRCQTEFGITNEQVDFCTIKQTDYDPNQDYRVYPEEEMSEVEMTEENMQETDSSEEMNSEENNTDTTSEEENA